MQGKTPPPPSRLAPADGAEFAPPAPAGDVDLLSARFGALVDELKRDAVETMREMGEVLELGARLLRGSYGDWVQNDLGISRSAANNYRRVLKLSQTTPELFREQKDLGASKMIRLGRVAPKKRRLVLGKRVGAKSVADMTDAEFARVSKPYLMKPRQVTGNRRAHGLRLKIQRVVSVLNSVPEFPPVENTTVRMGLASDLEELSRALKVARAAIR